MGYSVGFNGRRWIGYGVPAECDVKDCTTMIDRGKAYACEGCYNVGENDEDLWDTGCGGEFYFCGEHSYHQEHKHIMEEKGETLVWLEHIMTDHSWEEWRSSDTDYQKYYDIWKELKETNNG